MSDEARCEWCGRMAMRGDILCNVCVKMEIWNALPSKEASVRQPVMQARRTDEEVPDGTGNGVVGDECAGGEVGGVVGGLPGVSGEFSFIPAAYAVTWPRNLNGSNP